jgi:hypothetical protein
VSVTSSAFIVLHRLGYAPIFLIGADAHWFMSGGNAELMEDLAQRPLRDTIPRYERHKPPVSVYPGQRTFSALTQEGRIASGRAVQDRAEAQERSHDRIRAT